MTYHIQRLGHRFGKTKSYIVKKVPENWWQRYIYFIYEAPIVVEAENFQGAWEEFKRVRSEKRHGEFFTEE